MKTHTIFVSLSETLGLKVGLIKEDRWIATAIVK
jgi:hypothetical protein